MERLLDVLARTQRLDAVSVPAKGESHASAPMAQIWRRHPLCLKRQLRSPLLAKTGPNLHTSSCDRMDAG